MARRYPLVFQWIDCTCIFTVFFFYRILVLGSYPEMAKGWRPGRDPAIKGWRPKDGQGLAAKVQLDRVLPATQHSPRTARERLLTTLPVQLERSCDDKSNAYSNSCTLALIY
jgi:hypothetical protein